MCPWLYQLSRHLSLDLRGCLWEQARYLRRIHSCHRGWALGTALGGWGQLEEDRSRGGGAVVALELSRSLI